MNEYLRVIVRVAAVVGVVAALVASGLLFWFGGLPVVAAIFLGAWLGFGAAYVTFVLTFALPATILQRVLLGLTAWRLLKKLDVELWSSREDEGAVPRDPFGDEKKKTKT